MAPRCSPSAFQATRFPPFRPNLRGMCGKLRGKAEDSSRCDEDAQDPNSPMAWSKQCATARGYGRVCRGSGFACILHCKGWSDWATILFASTTTATLPGTGWYWHHPVKTNNSCRPRFSINTRPRSTERGGPWRAMAAVTRRIPVVRTYSDLSPGSNLVL